MHLRFKNSLQALLSPCWVCLVIVFLLTQFEKLQFSLRLPWLDGISTRSFLCHLLGELAFGFSPGLMFWASRTCICRFLSSKVGFASPFTCRWFCSVREMGLGQFYTFCFSYYHHQAPGFSQTLLWCPTDISGWIMYQNSCHDSPMSSILINTGLEKHWMERQPYCF